MKTFAFLHSACASQASDVRPSVAGIRGLVQKQLVQWVGLSALVLIPAATIAVADLASAGRPCCGGKSYRTISYSRHISYSRPHYGGLGPGSSGSAVAAVQRRLSYLGFPVSVDGVYGPETLHAVRAFQSANGLAPDGIVGPATASALKYDSNVAYRPPIACGRPDCDRPIRPIEPIRPIDECEADSCGPISVGPPVRENFRYIVAIPSDEPRNLARTQRVAPGAFITQSRLGNYINAGAFDDRDPAQRLADVLRAEGLDAQVRYREF